MRKFICLCLLLQAAILSALITEDSASANALSGVTLLSSSVADHQLSPLIGVSGFSLSYSRPFNMGNLGVYSLSSAFPAGFLDLNLGASYLDEGDYLWQDLRLGVAACYGLLDLGVNGHLLYERFSTRQSFHSLAADLALRLGDDDYATELRWLHPGLQDAQLHITLASQVTGEITAATSYVYLPQGKDMLRAATRCEIGENFLLLTSWQSVPSRFGAGIGVIWGRGELTYAVRSHPQLSLTHCLDIAYGW